MLCVRGRRKQDGDDGGRAFERKRRHSRSLVIVWNKRPTVCTRMFFLSTKNLLILCVNTIFASSYLQTYRLVLKKPL
ncbi:hypothetical protein L514_1176 [Bordetella bronchiseptica MBORD635]|nr:hypothetical protein L514_1176 [Bordetella bronchiseptica MBORD635]